MDVWMTFGTWVMAAYAAVATLVVLSAALRKFRRIGSLSEAEHGSIDSDRRELFALLTAILKSTKEKS